MDKWHLVGVMRRDDYLYRLKRATDRVGKAGQVIHEMMWVCEACAISMGINKKLLTLRKAYHWRNNG